MLYLRATVYKPRSVDPTETAVLVPTAAGAAHADAFQVTTHPALAGYKPYLQIPLGRRGQIDPLNKKVDIGTLAVTLLDSRTGAGNAQRWVTTFLGDASGHPQLSGCKCFLESSTDGVVWTPYFTGRIRKVELVGKVQVKLTLREMGDDLSTLIFENAPHASIAYAQRPPVLPIGLQQKWGGFTEIAPRLSGVMDGNHFLVFSQASIRSGGAMVTRMLDDLIHSGKIFKVHVDGYGLYDGVLHSIYGDGDGYVAGAWGHRALPALLLKYDGVLALPVATTAVTFYVTPDGLATSKDAPILIDDVHPAQLWADILDGYFGPLDSAGNVMISVPRNAGAFAALIADTSLPLVRAYIESSSKMNQWIEENICKPFHLTYSIDAQGRVTPGDLRLTAAGVTLAAALTDADLVAGGPGESWNLDADASISRFLGSYWIDVPVDDIDLQKNTDPIPDVNPWRITPVQAPLTSVYINTGVLDAGAFGQVQVSPNTLRTRLAEQYVAGQQRADWLVLILLALQSQLRGPFALGTQIGTAHCRRTAGVLAVNPGSFVSATFSTLPNVSNSQRGGTRIYFCTSVSDGGAYRDLTLLDLGTGAPAAAPTVATPVVDATNPKQAWSDVVTLSGVLSAELWVNITETSVGARPADADAGWRMVALVAATGTQRFSSFPSGKRVWVRARSMPQSTDTLALPSAWAYPAGTGYVDLTAITAPSALATSNLKGGSTDIGWTVGDPNYAIEVLLTTGAAPGSWFDNERIAYLAPGSTKFTINNLVASTQYTAAVRHRDQFGGISAVVTVTFNTTATLGTCPTMYGIAVL